MTQGGRDGMRKDKLTGDVIDFKTEVESRVMTSYDSFPVPHHTEIPLNILTKDGSEWFMEYSPAGTYPTSRWMDLDPEIQIGRASCREREYIYQEDVDIRGKQ